MAQAWATCRLCLMAPEPSTAWGAEVPQWGEGGLPEG